jgi:4-hydroxybenzoate-CoA ligase
VTGSASYNATADLLDRNIAAGRADKIAFADQTQTLTYGALQARTCRVANLLTRLGVRREERVAVVMLDSVDWPAVFLGAIRAGIVPVALNTLLVAEQYAYMLEDSRARVLFVSDALLPAIAPVLGDIPTLEHVVVVGAGETGGHPRLADLLAGESDSFATAATHADEPAFWLYSSGSTGRPKGTRHVHSSLMATAETYGQQVLGIREDDVCLSAAKLFFAYGLGNSLTFPLSVGASTILYSARPTPPDVFRLMAEHQPTLFFGVPTLYAAMLAAGPQDSAATARLRLCVSAGEALPAHVGEEWKARFGCDILDGVGSTEMLHIFLSNRPGDIVYGTSGRPVPGYDARLVSESGAPVPDGEVGELLVQGASAADGYWNQRQKSRTTFEGGWTRTGDKFVRDAAGRYTYCGRADDMFKVSGIWVSPFEVESALIAHPAVLEAAVIAAEDSDGLTKPKAFVVLKDGAPRDGLDLALKDHVKASVGPWKYPRWIEVVDGLPKTATGKIQRFKLRDAS